MAYNNPLTMEVDLTGTPLEDRYNLNALYGTGILERCGFISTNVRRDQLSLPDISQLSYTEGAEIIFKRRGERVLSAKIYAKEHTLEKAHQSLLSLIEESKPKEQNGKKTH